MLKPTLTIVSIMLLTAAVLGAQNVQANDSPAASAPTAEQAAAQAVSPSVVIPAPAQIELKEGSYSMKAENPAEDPGLKVITGDKRFTKLIRSKGLPQHSEEGAYSLSISSKGVTIKSITELGAYYAMQTLRQMRSQGSELAACEIIDWPRLRHRGIMIDISRNFRDADFIKKQIDALAALKMNRLHLHLTDDAGWRIEVKSHPELTSKAAFRLGKTWESWTTDGGLMYADEGNPLASGGYLTKEDAEELVAYAAERHIVIIPEFEIPGHSREVVSACPELACVDADGNPVITSDMCPGADGLLEFIDEVISDIVEMFPSEYIHIGGDEASKQSWKECPHCQAKMKEHGIQTVEGLQSWLIQEVEKIVESKGRKMIGWDEIMQGGLSENATVMVWRGLENAEEAMAQGHDVILSPSAYYYLDYTQDAPIVEPKSFGGYQPLERSYSFTPDDNPHLLGVQGNVWTEYIPTDEHLEYMLYPRAFAVAETGWSQPEHKDYADFRERAVLLCSAMQSKGYNTFDLANEYGNRPESLQPVSHLAVGKPVKFHSPYNKTYSAEGDKSINDGICGTWTYSDRRWLGFLRDLDVVIDLEEVTDVHYVGGTFMSSRGAGVSLPEKVEVYFSEDGENYTLAGTAWNGLNADTSEQAYVTFPCVVSGKTRFVRFKAYRRDMPNHEWLFIDEVIVN